ncbi:MAG TPA: hypothetical protein VMT59_11665 [Gaiellaceae bacterium]|nr:hypothetical protein [Gaiellaceae bacterium]
MGDAPDPQAEFRALQAVISALQGLDHEARKRILASASTFLEIDSASSGGPRSLPDGGNGSAARPGTASYPSFGEDRVMSPKEFVVHKQPRSDVERIAVLAYYLTHYRDTQFFKTLDLSKLNTEAAQPKFSNAANSANNAVKRGYLVSATKGQRQLSAAGEQFVNALPDREAARAAMTAAQPRRRVRRPAPKRPVEGQT